MSDSISDLPIVDGAVARKLLGLAGLGVRARNAVVGVQQVREAALKGKLRVAVVAADISHHSLDKVVPLLRARRITFWTVPSAVDLGAAVGRESTAAVGIVDSQLARGMRAVVQGGPAAAPVSGSDRAGKEGV